MQDEINEKIVALSIRAGGKALSLSAAELKAAMQKYLQHQEKVKARKAAKQAYPRAPRGKQRYGQLVKQNQGLKSVEITDQNIRSFDRVANRYKIDYALKADKSVDPPRFLVFFKAKDAEVMEAAFREFSARELAGTLRPSVRERLAKYQQRARAQHRQRERVKNKERGQEL